MRGAAVFFCMSQPGHFRRLAPLIAGVAEVGLAPHVFTDARYGAEVERAGGRFHDLFGPYPQGAADADSTPQSIRGIAFAARYAEEIARDVEALGPSIVIHDTFAVIARVVALRLGLPRVNVCAGHNVRPSGILPFLRSAPRVRPSPAALRAVEVLRERYGMADASPLMYVEGRSPDLNVYGEPDAYIDPETRAELAPLAAYGSLEDPAAGRPRREGRSSLAGAPRGAVRVYVSLGTICWRWYPDEVGRALRAIAGALGEEASVRAVVSTGGRDIEAPAALARPNVAVEPYVDQEATLADADLFVTHHGLNSTHEAIFGRVPMISAPVFWDQPALAARCEAMGLAVPLGCPAREEITSGAVRAALARALERRAPMREALERARALELEVMARRGEVHARIAGIAARGRG